MRLIFNETEMLLLIQHLDWYSKRPKDFFKREKYVPFLEIVVKDGFIDNGSEAVLLYTALTVANRKRHKPLLKKLRQKYSLIETPEAVFWMFPFGLSPQG